MNVSSATRRRRVAGRARRPTGSALLLVVLLGGVGGIMPLVGTQVSGALRAWNAGAFGPVFTVMEVQRAVARHPGRWLGQTVQVRGRLGFALVRMCLGDPDCVGQPTLADAAPVGAMEPLPLEWGGLDPLQAALRHLPLLSRLLPLASEPRWGTVETYRVRLDAAPDVSYGEAICYSAVLLDVAQRDDCYPRHRERPLFPCAGP